MYYSLSMRMRNGRIPIIVKHDWHVWSNFLFKSLFLSSEYFSCWVKSLQWKCKKTEIVEANTIRKYWHSGYLLEFPVRGGPWTWRVTENYVLMYWCLQKSLHFVCCGCLLPAVLPTCVIFWLTKFEETNSDKSATNTQFKFKDIMDSGLYIDSLPSASNAAIL